MAGRLALATQQSSTVTSLPDHSDRRSNHRKGRLKEIVHQKAILHGDFILSSGLPSSYYFDGKMVTHDPEGLSLIGSLIFDAIKDQGIQGVGGLTMGADPIAAATALVSHLRGQPIPAFTVRREAKQHGTRKMVEGQLPPKGARVAIVDDVITTGYSVLKAIEAAEAEGCVVAKVIVVVDRQQGGAQEIRKRGYPFEALLTADDQGNVRA